MLPGEIRRYKQSSFPLLSAIVGSGQTGHERQTSSFPRLPGSGGQAGTILPQIRNQAPLVTLSQEDRNINIYMSTRPAKYAAHARRERAPDRNHTNKGKRSRGVADSDLHSKAGQIGGQNSKPLSKQRSKRKHGNKGESSAPITLDESERSSLEKIADSNSKHSSMHRRRHKSHLRDSPYSAHMAGKVDQRRRLKSCDRSSAKTAKSLSEVKDEFRRHSRESKLTDIEISLKQKQRITSHVSDAKKDTAVVAPIPTSGKRWKCVMVRHSNNSTPMWVGDVPAESWEEDCRNAKKLAKHVNVNKKETIAETVSKKNDITKFEAHKKTEAAAIKNDKSSKTVQCTDKRIHKRLSKSSRNHEEAVEENVTANIRHQESKDVKQNEKKNNTLHTTQVNGLSRKLTPRKHIFDVKIKRAKVVEKIKLPEYTNRKGKVHEIDTSKARYIEGINSPADVHSLQNSYGRIKKQQKVIDTIATNNNSKTLQGKKKDKAKQGICKEIHMVGGQFNPGRNEKHVAKEDAYHRDIIETVHKEDKAKTKKKYTDVFIKTNEIGNKKVPATSSEKTNDQINVDSRTSNNSTTDSSSSGSFKSCISSARRQVSSKCVNTKSDHKQIKTTPKTSTLNSPVSHASTISVAEKRTITPTSKTSHSIRTQRSVTSASTERSADRHSNKKTRVPILRKSPVSERMDSTKASSPEQIEKVTPVIGRPSTSRSAIPVRKTVTPISVRPASTKSSSAMPERSVATKSVKGLHAYRTSNTQLPGPSSTSTAVPASGSVSSKCCLHKPQKQTFARSDSDCGRPQSVKSKIPVPIKAASYASGKTTTKSASPSFGKPTAAKPMTPVLRRTTPTKFDPQMSGKVSAAKNDSAKNNTVLCGRPVSRNESSDPANRKSSLPVPVRSPRANSCSKRPILSASKSSTASSSSSASSIRHMPGKSNVLPNRLSNSQASRRLVNVSMCTYDDDFEYESDESRRSASLSQNSYENYPSI